jgi:predicted nucleic acid-binding protein
MGIEVVPLDLGTFLRSGECRKAHGLLTNDSLVAASALEHGVSTIASADEDFDRVGGLKRHGPGDLGK